MRPRVYKRRQSGELHSKSHKREWLDVQQIPRVQGAVFVFDDDDCLAAACLCLSLLERDSTQGESSGEARPCSQYVVH
jgi:hypothetical protein